MTNYIFEWIFFANGSGDKVEITFGNLQEEWKYDHLPQAKGKKVNAVILRGEKATKLNEKINQEMLKDTQKFLSGFMGSTLIIKGVKKEPVIALAEEGKVNFEFEGKSFDSVIIAKGEDEKKVLRDLETNSEQTKPEEPDFKKKTQQEQKNLSTSNEKTGEGLKNFFWIGGVIIFLLTSILFYFWWKKRKTKK